MLDLGLAKLMERPQTDGSSTQSVVMPLTHDGMKLGTAAYVSPERAEGHPIDARSDIFSFGLCFMNCLQGGRRFTAARAWPPSPRSCEAKGTLARVSGNTAGYGSIRLLLDFGVTLSRSRNGTRHPCA